LRHSARASLGQAGGAPPNVSLKNVLLKRPDSDPIWRLARAPRAQAISNSGLKHHPVGVARANRAKRAAGKAKRTGAKSTATRTKETDDANSFDPHAFANRVKGDDQIATFQKKIISVKADWYNKTAFVLWFADEPLTSGQIHKALGALGVKGALARVSVALADNMNSFITSEQRKVGVTAAYSLVPSAKTKFAKWLLEEPRVNG
jgi:hypothetical protein